MSRRARILFYCKLPRIGIYIRKRGISFSNFCFLLPIFFSFFMKKEAKDCNSFKRHLTRLLLTYYTFVHFSLLMFLKMRTEKGKKKVEEITFLTIAFYCLLFLTFLSLACN